MAVSPQEGAVGVEIILQLVDANDVPLDISDATTKDIILRRADGETMTVAGAFAAPPLGAGDGSDGLLVYTTVAGDLVPFGTWRAQAYIVKPGLDTKTKVCMFAVLKNA